jgi:1-acyl-sn-glycerol-3-phosphate acyltransferase
LTKNPPTTTALTTALKIMQQGIPFAIAPEGTRSKSGKLLEGHEGVAFIATRANVPIVPVAAVGTNLMFKQVRRTVSVTIGKAIQTARGTGTGRSIGGVHRSDYVCHSRVDAGTVSWTLCGNPLIAEMAKVVR